MVRRALKRASLASAHAEVREEVLAFDASMRRHKWRMLAASFAIWMAAAAAFRFGVNDTSWVEGAGAFVLLLAATGFALLSVWFGHYKFRLNADGAEGSRAQRCRGAGGQDDRPPVPSRHAGRYV